MSESAPHVRIWRQPDGWWRWCYVEPGRDGAADTTLISNEAYGDPDEARGSATTAYPDVELRDMPPDETPHRPPGRALRLATLVVLVVGVLSRRRNRR
jgi:hypothetical protein